MFSNELEPLLKASASDIGQDSSLRVGDKTRAIALPDHEQALRALLKALDKSGHPLDSFAVAGHRVVHGGETLTAPARVNDAIRAEIAANSPLAPLHNPHNLAAIDALSKLAPDLPQSVSFDTAFHTTNPGVATQYALPATVRARGIRRYGFHGLSFASLVDRLPEISESALPHRLLALHLGNGASLCAIVGGRSVATTMGYSPLDGLTMGTRCGGIDPAAVLRLAQEDGIDETQHMLTYDSGLKGLSGGQSDMRSLLADPGRDATFAVDHFTYWTRRHIGSMVAAMGGVDALAFTGGIGENAAMVRERIMDGLEWLGLQYDLDANSTHAPRLHIRGSRVGAWIVPAQEEKRIAADALRVLVADNT